jgi:hypothetical protein
MDWIALQARGIVGIGIAAGQAMNALLHRSRTGNPMVDLAGLRKIGYIASFAA